MQQEKKKDGQHKKLAKHIHHIQLKSTTTQVLQHPQNLYPLTKTINIHHMTI